MNALGPDVIILGSDIVEEGTSNASNEACLSCLEGLKVHTALIMFTEIMTDSGMSVSLHIQKVSWQRGCRQQV